MALDCLAITLTAGVILKEALKPTLVGERHFGEGNLRGQTLSQDNGETILAVRHLDVSHGPLGTQRPAPNVYVYCFLLPDDYLN